MPKLQSDYEACCSGRLWINCELLGFFTMHLNKSTRVFAFKPRGNAATVVRIERVASSFAAQCHNRQATATDSALHFCLTH